MTRDKLYDITQGTPGSRIIYFTANPNGEAEIIKVTMEPDLSKKRQSIFLEKDFSEILIKGRAAKGNLLTKRTIRRIGLKSHGHSTLGGRKVWFDPDVNRINYDENGRFLGEFNDDDSILVVLDNGEFYITNFDVNNHYEDNILRLEKWDEHKIWTAILYDADNQGYPYIKRFTMDATKRHQNFMGENPNCKLILLTDTAYPRLQRLPMAVWMPSDLPRKSMPSSSSRRRVSRQRVSASRHGSLKASKNWSQPDSRNQPIQQ